MTFHDLEISTDDGKPVVLYEFALGTTVWRYCAGPENVSIYGYTYTQCPISNEAIKQSTDANSDALQLLMPSRIGVAQVFIGTPPAQRVLVRIRHLHEGDNDAPLVYVGEILQADWPEPGSTRLVAFNLSASLAREGLRLAWQRTCPFALYDPLTCKVTPGAHRTSAILTGAGAGAVTAPEFATLPEGSLAGGFLEWEHPVRGTERRGIEAHVGDTLALFGLSDGLYHGLPVYAYRGCDRRIETCNSVFSNLANYGGVPSMPGKSPFDGDPVF